MYVRASAPRTIGGVLDDAISLYRNSYASVWPFTLAAAVVVAMPGAFLGWERNAFIARSARLSWLS